MHILISKGGRGSGLTVHSTLHQVVRIQALADVNVLNEFLVKSLHSPSASLQSGV